MIEAVIGSLVESITTLLVGKAITFSVSKKTKRMSTPQMYKESSEETSLILGGELGESLIEAYKNYKETNNQKTIENFIKKATHDNEITFVIEISRKAEEDVRLQLKRPVEYTVCSTNEIQAWNFPSIAKRISDFIRTINTVHKGPKIHLILSAPVVLGFEIGQFVGFSHYNIELYHFERGKYMKVPPVRR